MKKIVRKLFLSALMFVMAFNIITPVKAATSFSVSASAGSVGPNGTFTVYVSSNGEGRVTASASNGSITSASSIWYPEGKAFTVKANGSGTVSVTVTAVTLSDGKDEIVNASKTVNVNVVQPPKPKVETEAEKKARLEKEAAAKKEREEKEAAAKLEARKNTPMITNLSLVSNSERMKDSEVKNIKTEVSKFAYEVTLPRNVNEFKINTETIAKDVVVTKEEAYAFGENQDKLEIKLKTKQDEITQDYTITVNKYQDSKVTVTDNETVYDLLVDPVIDKKLKKLGIEKTIVDPKKDKEMFMYEYEGKKFTLVYDTEKTARWFFIDETNTLLDEFVLLIDENNIPRFIENVTFKEDTEVPTLMQNKYEEIEIQLPEVITSLDESVKFNNLIKGWKYDETSVVTHEFNNVVEQDEDVPETINETKTEVNELDLYNRVVIDQSGSIKTAVVVFDAVGSNSSVYAIVVTVLLVLVSIAFAIYVVMMQRKMKLL